MADALLPFGKKGPDPLIRTEPTERTTSDGRTVTTSWAYPWFVSSVQREATVPQVRAWLQWVFSITRNLGCGRTYGSPRYGSAETPA